MHYYNWMSQSWRKWANDDVSKFEVTEMKEEKQRVMLKQLITALRLLFAVRWLQSRNEIVPLDFNTLLNASFEGNNEFDNDTEPETLKAFVQRLVEARKTGTHVTEVWDEFEAARAFVYLEIDRFKDRKFRNFDPVPNITIDEADSLFHDSLRRTFACNI